MTTNLKNYLIKISIYLSFKNTSVMQALIFCDEAISIIFNIIAIILTNENLTLSKKI